MSDDQLNSYVRGFYEDALQVSCTSSNMTSTNNRSYISCINTVNGTVLTANATSSNATWSEYKDYTNKTFTVSSSVPSIGICSIVVLYNANMKKLSTNNVWYINTVTVTDSWQTGISLASWDFKYSTVTIGGYETDADVDVTGVLTYGIPNTVFSASTTVTFGHILCAGDITG